MKDLEYICKLMYESFKVPVFYLDKEGEIIFDFSSNYKHTSLYVSKKNLLHQLFHCDNPHEFPVHVTTNYMENYFSISLKDKNLYKGTIIVGPSIHTEITKEMIKGLLIEYNISKNETDIIHYYQSLPIISHLQFIYMSMHFYYMIYNEKLDISSILQQNKSLVKIPLEITNANVTILQRRQDNPLHQDPLHERRIFQAVKEGRKDELMQYQKMMRKDTMGILSKTSHLRSEKNLAIAGITLATRAALEGGLHPQIAYTLSDLFIQNIEEIKNSKDLFNFLEDAICDFTDRVRKNNKQKFSKPISLCQNYIFSHLYEDVPLSKLAQLTELHPNYLSTLFKKETGISVIEYIQRTKVEEAKDLITYTDYSLSD
ncbi:AraC family transcriptional regulator, partial [Bacillus sp. JJ722]|uniref:AraC family transcriptional regulator n=1 Tax=Bacillus sp. JJ722 TaxID=3122973 RepID=UPI002FFF91B5